MDTTDDPVVREGKRFFDQTIVRPVEKAGEEAGRISLQPFELVGKALTPEMPGSPATPGTGPPAMGVATSPAPTKSDIIPGVSTDAQRRKRHRAAASVLTRDWLPPTLGTPGLLGIS